ncbi:MAG: hypothetical protein V1755_04105 [Chloroflexota bacterium]
MRASQGSYIAMAILAGLCAGALLGVQPPGGASAQAPATDTALPGIDQAYITNTFEEAVNVRAGPSTITFPIPCGSLPVGATTVALGTTPARAWVQIEFPECPGGVGWVYAEYVMLTGSVREVESPPTSTPLASATFDPTLVAAFQVEPTVTRLPTFTPPPPLVRPTFTEAERPRGDFPTGAAIMAAALLGGLVLAVSFIFRR